VARFLSPAWVEGFNAALAGVELPGPGSESGLAASGGAFTVAQEVHGTPDGEVRLLLTVADGTLCFSLLPPATEAGAEDVRPDVTMALSYGDAAAMSSGELDPAEALRTGRIRVRGDLSVLVAARQMLDSARRAAADFASSTTY
jgi:putative sterol carrier protein